MPDERTEARILTFLRDKFLDGDPRSELDVESPLLEWGVLNSMNTAILLMHLRDELGAPVPPDRINSRNLKNVRSIAEMVLELSAPADSTPR
ncbi:phosphopantetheine-binding protein [Streptomyces sp. NPDC021622]|uniref:acyl carrier protein n=1 Tax=Streptomyces sp. NPDC021622 TaxID=3155013 RepID=UPI0033DA418E